LTANGTFHHDSGFAPQFPVAEIFMRDLRYAAEKTSTAAGYAVLSELPAGGAESVDKDLAQTTFESSSSRRALQASIEAANKVKVAAAHSRVLISAASSLAGAQQSGDKQQNNVTGVSNATPASVMTKLQNLQSQLLEARWRPGQPLPASIGNPAALFQGEKHLLPPALATALDAMLASAGPMSASSVSSQTPHLTPSAPGKAEGNGDSDDCWE
jgi:hypothetical protein